jgi:formylglycine-generating enzyme required for sulfatase activity
MLINYFKYSVNKKLRYAFILIIGLSVFPVVAESQAIKSYRDCLKCPEMIDIPKGSFLMGSDYGRSEEKPVHKVSIKKRFAVGKYEVTRGQYSFFVNSSGYPQKIGCEVFDLPSFNMNYKKSWIDPDFLQDDDHPVVCVNWDDAQTYVSWLSTYTGEQYRLLSESEWEYLARAGSTTRYSFGDNIDSKYANYGDEFRRTTTVGSYHENAFGVHDVHGNVAEWVADCWVDNYINAHENGEPVADDPCRKRVFRGGTWHNAKEYLLSAFRYGYIAEFRLSGLGFRVAKQP